MGFSYYVLSFLKKPPLSRDDRVGVSFINDHHKQRNEYYRGDFQSTF